MLFVNELFASVQGEGVNTGVPSIFIRLQGCRCECPFCDTKFTWKLGSPNEIGLEFAYKKADAPRYSTCTARELFDFVNEKFDAAVPHVVITGGEPCLFDLRELTKLFLDSGRSVQIETSATEEILVDDRTWVTASPKIGMPGGREVLDSALARADEVKMAVESQADIDRLEAILPKLSPKAVIELQPVSQDPEATKLCIETCMKKGWRLSLQTHKFSNVR